MKQGIYQAIREFYWQLPLNESIKERAVAKFRILARSITKSNSRNNDSKTSHNKSQDYINQILNIPEKSSSEYTPISPKKHLRKDTDPKLLAYYLPQFHPTPYNDEWWGKGVTEWNNVSTSVPQFTGHYQPRFPAELGYYDLRLIENIHRQVELAQHYGIYGFTFYYYWFDGKRLLDKPLDLYLEDKDINFPFNLCWANESWTRRFDGTCGETLIAQNDTVESYKDFIASTEKYFSHKNYIRIDGKPVLNIYRPSFIPDIKETIKYWREYCVKIGIGEIYLVGTREHTWDKDLIDLGFDSQCEFHPGTLFKHCMDITNSIDFIRKDFGGIILSYKDIVENKKYFLTNHKKLFRSAMPMWDNTARRNNVGMIFEGSTPALYKQWLLDIIRETKADSELDDQLVYINAWNEWGEGAYLEPDRRYGYSYLQATKEAVEESRT